MKKHFIHTKQYDFLDKMATILDDSQAGKFTDKLFNCLDDYRSSSRHSRSRKRKVCYMMLYTYRKR